MRQRTLFIAAVSIAALVIPQVAGASGRTAPPSARVHGHSYSAWAQAWGQWAFGDASNPLIASLDGDCGDLVGGAYFMVAPIDVGLEFDCAVPVGTPIVVTHAGSFGWIGADGETDAELVADVRADFGDPPVNHLSLDGRALPLFVTQTGAWDVDSQSGSFFDAVFELGTGDIRTALAGNFTVILPLSPGEHELEADVDFGANGAFSATYQIHVG
jgi:hypothetical protein